MENKYHPIITISLALILIVMTIKYSNETHTTTLLQKNVDSLSYVTDSLTYEVIIREMEITRHEITRDEIFYNKPKLKKEYEEYYERNTE